MEKFDPYHAVEMSELLFHEHNRNKFIDIHMVYVLYDDHNHNIILGRDFNTLCWENTGGIQKGEPPSSAPQNQTSTSTWNPTSSTWWYA